MDQLEQVLPFGFYLPENLIAKKPLAKRDESKLLIVDKKTGEMGHTTFMSLSNLLSENDVLVFNHSKVFPARLIGKKQTGTPVEVLILHETEKSVWRAICHPGLKHGTKIFFENNVIGYVVGHDKISGEIDIAFTFKESSFIEMLEKIGHTPIPHYIAPSLSEKNLRERYQTVYAKQLGSVAAPTAGLHFTDELLQQLHKKNIQQEFITLHVGLGTFQKLREEHFSENALHTESFEVDKSTADSLNQAKKNGKRIIAVGTTTTRTLESVVDETGMIVGKKGETSLFIQPPYRFRFVDSMITNFHLPYSSLLMLVAAFTSYPNTNKAFETFERSQIGAAYKEAIEHNYRFYSFGDAMFIK